MPPKFYKYCFQNARLKSIIEHVGMLSNNKLNLKQNIFSSKETAFNQFPTNFVISLPSKNVRKLEVSLTFSRDAEMKHWRRVD